MRPTVVILDSSIAVTGGLRCAQRMAKLLAPWMQTVLVLPLGADIPPRELDVFAHVERLPLVQLRRSASSILTYVPSLLTSGVRLRGLLVRHRAAALIVNDFFQLQGWVVRRLGWRGRIVTWVRFDPSRFPAPIARAWLIGARQASSQVVAVSRFIWDRLPKNLNARIVYDCIDPDLEEPGPEGVRRDIVCVGNYIPGKGQAHAIDAFALIAGRFPQTKLKLFGGDMGLAKNRTYRRKLEQRVAEMGLTDRVIFNDFAPEPAVALAGAAISLNLSESESFSLTCLEAQQLGVPVVAFRSGGPEEIIVHGETGFLLPLGDIDAVADAICRLLSSPELAKRMGAVAAASIRNRFGPEAFVEMVRPLLLGTGA